ncbi:unnamed protein product [Polarella glacialis]|uniref:Uncharacterized protein n=1 Tax=Polarella glacialis TaxID=89957 RepID=A0A813DKP1_POLGL|nr:unnamed protein product [Polarella glacialis]CAE8638916.1 unnamed protein product [Polarella glacialis]
MAAPATPQETSVFMQLGAAITCLTDKIDKMTVSTQDTTSAIRKIEANQGGGPPDSWWTDKFGNTPQFSQFPGVSRSTASSQSAAGVSGGAASSQSAAAGLTSSGNHPAPGIPPRQAQAPNTTAQTRSRSPLTRKVGPTTVTRGEDL